jgi:ISXO2-like transposase domain
MRTKNEQEGRGRRGLAHPAEQAADRVLGRCAPATPRSARSSCSANLRLALSVGPFHVSARPLCPGVFPTDKLDGTDKADETYVAGMKRGMGRRYSGNKTAVVSLVERDGRVRSHVSHKVTGDVLGRLLKEHVSQDAHLNTDEAPLYRKSGREIASHDTVNHMLWRPAGNT